MLVVSFNTFEVEVFGVSHNATADTIIMRNMFLVSVCYIIHEFVISIKGVELVEVFLFTSSKRIRDYSKNGQMLLSWVRQYLIMPQYTDWQSILLFRFCRQCHISQNTLT